ncbi:MULTISPECIES: CDP-glycerol glycerophosphotransferase family protein [Halorussus]|uniref:CDP-glycerol glycerophosphotransferase family protein n=1 Tax=Halorussus TaxID=1070314 RepID=UPI00209CDF73|nr:CDP-glycerol glycerophosphotransferase family protein [Halorussus vallis]USZ76763.1 CDP-glycerol glycerophosphotransferase family protein [Halorussus vallis]
MTGATDRVRRWSNRAKERLDDAVGRLRYSVQYAGYLAVALLDGFREREESLWVFGARGGEAFADNTKYLYLHVAAEHPEIRPVWLAKDPDVVAELQANGYEAYRRYSLRGLALNLRAGVAFLTQGHRDLAMPACAGALTVLLWHGVPLKTISWDAEFPDEPPEVRAIHAAMAEEIDLLAVPSAELVDVFESGLRISRDRMGITGYPRNDALFGSIPGEELGTDAGALARVRALASDHPVVCYLPTYRSDAADSPTDHLDLRALDEFLAERDAYLVVKTHPKEEVSLPPNLDRIVQLPAATDVYPLLRYADALVTDYSSAYFDFLSLDRPVVFYPYDLERYRRRRGFYFDYDEVTPGPVVREFDGLLAALDGVLTDGDPYGDDRRAFRERLLDRNSDGSPGSASRSRIIYDTIRRRLTGENDEPDE